MIAKQEIEKKTSLIKYNPIDKKKFYIDIIVSVVTQTKMMPYSTILLCIKENQVCSSNYCLQNLQSKNEKKVNFKLFNSIAN